MQPMSGRRTGVRPARGRVTIVVALACGVLAAVGLGASAAAIEPGATAGSVACAGPAAGRVSCWAAEGNANDSIGSNHGVLQNGTTFTAGVVGSAFLFDGVDDVVSVAHSASIDFAPGAAMSVAFWMDRTSGATIQHMIGKRALCIDENFNWQMAFDASSFQFGEKPPNGTAVAEKPPIGTWIHVTGTQAGNEWRFYVNGDLKASAAGKLGPVNTAAMLMGSAGPTCQHYGGALDEIQIWSRALTDDQVAQTFRPNAVCTAKPAAPAPLAPAANQKVATRPTLDWTARGCATRYDLEVRRGSATGPVAVSRSGLTTSKLTTPALAAGKTWAWRATACNAHGCRTSAWRTFRT
jgi:hypothetical protein